MSLTDHRLLTPDQRRALRIVGRSTDPFRVRVERVKLIEYARALHLRNPIHWDAAAAQAAGYRDVVAVPGFITSLTLQQRDIKFSCFGFDESKSLLGELSWRCRAVVCAGDEVSGRSVLIETAEKKGRWSMDISIIETRLTNQLGEAVMDFRETHIERMVQQ